MPDAIITSTASTFGTISGTFAADQSTVTGTVTGIVAGTLSGSVGVPGPAGPAGAGVPAGGTAGQYLQKIDGTNYNTDWVTLNLSAYLTKAANLSDLTNFATARDNLSLGTLNTPTFAGVTVQGSGANVANLTPTSLSLNHATSGSFVIQPSAGITFPDTTIQTTAFNATAMLPYALINSQVFTGTPSLPAGTIGVTAALGDNDTSLATTAFVQQELLSGTANAKNLEVYVRNQTGSTLAAGSIVYINGATGNRPTVTLAQANNDANSAQTMGFVKTAIAHNGFGYVIVRGECENLDTSAVAEGTQLYLSPTVAGAYTTTKPSAPQHLVYVGIVIRSHPTQGVILVAVQNGYELNELHDVSISSPTNGQVLKYNSTTGLWYNGTDSAGVAWGGITGTLSSQTDLQTALDGKYSTTNPAGYITSSALTPYATLESPALTGNVTITTNSTSPALVITQDGTGDVIQFKDATSDTTYSFIDQNGKVGTVASTTTSAGFNVPHGTAPTSPVNGDIWTTTGNLWVRINGASQAVALQGNSAQLSSNNIFTNASSTYGNSTAAGTINLGTGATISGATKVVNIGTGGVAGSTTNIAIGSTTGTSTTTLQGITNGVTQSAGDSSLKLATTAFVTTADNLKANLASPTFTGTPTLPTGTIAVTQSAGNNTTAVATTAFVQQEVPAASTTAAGKVELATIGEALQGNSTTLVPSLEAMTWALMNSSYRPYFNVTGGSSGTGAFTNPVPPFRYEVGSPNTLTAGNAYVHTNNLSGMSPGRSQGVFDFGKKFWVSFALDNLNATYVGDANNEMKVYWGPSPSNGDDPAGMAIGVFKAGGSSSVWNLMVHDGTTLRKVASTVTLTTGEVQRFMIYSDGAGNVKMYINGTEAATSANGPTGTRSDARFVASVKQTASATARILIVLWYPKICSAP